MNTLFNQTKFSSFTSITLTRNVNMFFRFMFVKLIVI